MQKAAKHGILGGIFTLMVSISAQAEEAFYMRALGGLGALSDTSLDSSTLGRGDAEFDVGFSGGAGVGYDFGRWRLEGEIMYRTNTVDDVAGTIYDGADDGDFSSLGFGVNALYEFNLLENPNFTSYAGVGLVWFQEIDIDVEPPGGERSYSGDDTAVQLICGARYDLKNRFALYAEVRQLVADSIEMDGEGAATGTFEADYDRTELVLGLSYRF